MAGRFAVISVGEELSEPDSEAAVPSNTKGACSNLMRALVQFLTSRLG
jgi:hypothetical protein